MDFASVQSISCGIAAWLGMGTKKHVVINATVSPCTATGNRGVNCVAELVAMGKGIARLVDDSSTQFMLRNAG